MNVKQGLFRLWIVASVLWVLPAQAQNPEVEYTKGVDAYEAGNYAKALKIWLPLAKKKGAPSAQYNLSIMYSNGEGVKKDETEAVKWLLLAANQAHPQAQNDLAVSYLYGIGVKRDYPQAYMWFSFAAMNYTILKLPEDRKLVVRNRDIAAGLMTQSQIKEAQRLARKETTGQRLVREGAGWK